MAARNTTTLLEDTLLDADSKNYHDKISRYLNIVGPSRSPYSEERVLFIKMAAFDPPTAREITAVLLRFGENINETNNLEKTALHIALEHDNCNPAMVQLLLENGADPNFTSCTRSISLHSAVQNRSCSVDVIKLLLAKGANIEALNDLGDTPFLRAVRNPNCTKKILACLLDNGADISKANNYGRTALHSAVEHFESAPKIVKFLLKKGAPINVQNHSGKSPLFRAVECYCEPKILMLMLDRGADLFYGGSVFETTVNNLKEGCRCHKKCNGICIERSVKLLFFLIKFSILLDLNFDVDLFISSMQDYEQLSQDVYLYREQAQAMDSQLIAKETNLREFLSGRKKVRFFDQDEVGGELCSIHTLLHFLKFGMFHLYEDLLASKLRMKVLRHSLGLYSDGKPKMDDHGPTSHTFHRIADQDVVNLALVHHSAAVCELCRQMLLK